MKTLLILVNKVGFVNSYSFIYSPRPGTPASEKSVNDSTDNKYRLKKLQGILEDFQLDDNKKHIEKYCEVMIENKFENESKYFGRTKFMTPVKFESDSSVSGELIKVKITSCNQNSLFGYYKENKDKAA